MKMLQQTWRKDVIVGINKENQQLQLVGV